MGIFVFHLLTFLALVALGQSPACYAQPATADPPAKTTERLYNEALRPQLCFTADRNWLNDPNGLVCFQGEYHLFFQHNPHGIEWGNMTWGHAVSDDLVHWRQLANAIEPDALGTIFSGSAVVDWHNTTGFQSGNEPALVAIYTAAGGTSPESQGAKFTQCLAYSNDRGRTWTKYAGNPVVPHIVGENRDPKVVWHEPTKSWIMALYLDQNNFALFRSPDLIAWQRTDDLTIPGSIECPDLFEMPVAGRTGVKKWIFWTANNVYLVGDFDGRQFTPAGEPQRFELGANCFAAQTFSDAPDGRRIQIAWMRDGKYPGMPFNQQMTFPTELTLHAGSDGYQLQALPVRELASLREEPFHWSGKLPDADNPLAKLDEDLYELAISIEPDQAAKVQLDVRGVKIAYDAAAGTLSLGDRRVEVPLVDGKLELRVLIDRTSIQLFANEGAVTISNCYLPDMGQPHYRLSGANAEVDLTAWSLKSIWE